MLETISTLFDPAELSPHGLCLLWRPELIWLHVVSDAVTGLAYYSIPLALVAFVHWRRDLVFGWMFGLFALFILACGTTHFFSIWTLWHPDYGIQGAVKAATATVSILTAIMLWPLLPKAVALPSPTQLAILNTTLQREIAERREAETRLRASEARYAGFFNNLAEGLFISAVDADSHLILEAINRNLATTVGLDPARSIGHPLDEVLPPAVAAEIEQRYRSNLSTGQAIEYEQTVELLTGAHTWHTVLVPLCGEHGRVVQLLGSIRDITERQQGEAALKQAKEQAETASRAKSEFIAGMSHELRTPLNAVIGFGEILASQMLGPLGNPRYAEYAGDIVHSGQHLLELINGLLDSARLEAGKFILHKQAINLGELVTQAVQLTRSEQAGHCVVVDLPCPAPTLQVDRRAILQVLINLLGNACKFTPAGGRITVSAASDAHETCIVIRDTGIGIPAKRLGELGRPFTRVESVLTRRHPGTGMGLYISKSLVELHGGCLSVESIVGQGTAIRFTLPNTPNRPRPNSLDTNRHFAE